MGKNKKQRSIEYVNNHLTEVAHGHIRGRLEAIDDITRQEKFDELVRRGVIGQSN